MKRRYSLTKDSTKKCSKCGHYKNVAEFGWANKKRGWKAGECRDCARERVRDYYRRKRAPVIEYLKNHACVDCGENDYIVLDFDHVRGEKLFTIANAWSKSWEEVEKEIAKCDVRCKNCHHRRHHRDGFGGGKPISNKDAKEYYEIEEDEKTPDPQLSIFDLL